MTNKFQQSQVRPRLGRRAREAQGAEQRTEPAGPHPRTPLIATEPVLGLGTHVCPLLRAAAPALGEGPPREPAVRMGPAAGKSLSPTPAATVDSPDPYSTETSGPEGARHSCGVAVALACLSRLHAQTPPKKLRSHATPATAQPGARLRWCPLGELHVRSKASQRRPLPPGANLREPSGGLRFTELP